MSIAKMKSRRYHVPRACGHMTAAKRFHPEMSAEAERQLRVARGMKAIVDMHEFVPGLSDTERRVFLDAVREFPRVPEVEL